MIGMTTWDELKVLLTEHAADQEGPLLGYPMPSVDVGRTPPFQISLAAWAVDVAAELDARFGDDVVLTVGALHFPSRTLRNPDGSIQQPPQPSAEPLLASDEAEVLLAGDVEVRSGRHLMAELRVRNRTQTGLELRTNGNVTAQVMDPSSRAVVGGYAGAQRMPLVIFRADPGESIAVPLLVGTASIDSTLGYAVPAGLWAMEADLDFGDNKRRTPLLPLSVVP
jgi:hypothetical protein